ncbi:cysteine hydrolase family protein [Zoogloea sp.]|uniref:cysteine hydrolase family protein n=1 Tax=Zoogloea sp. TaxID=49181 RepID=UPI0035AF991F
MPNPITLRNLGGRSAAPAALTASTLVLIDCQNTYREGVMALSGVEAALDEIAALLARARRLGVPVIHIQHDAGPGSPYDVSAPIGAIADKVAPAAGEPVVLKHFPNSFIGTDLEARLKATGRQNVVFVGFMTHMCVNSTTRGAFNLGFAPTVVASATATRDLPDPHGNVVPAATLQAASLAALGDLFAVVVPDVAALPDA